MKLLAFAGRRTSSWAVALMLSTGTYSAYTQIILNDFQVTITSPTNGASFTAPTNIQIDVTTYATNDNVAYVAVLASPYSPFPLPHQGPEFSIIVGVVSNGVPVGPPGSHQEQFTVTWSNAPFGAWALFAQATSTNGGNIDQQTSSLLPVIIKVHRPIPAFSVGIASPADGSTFLAPTNIQLIAGVTDTNGPVAEVQFFDGTNSIGIVTNGAVVDPPGSPGLPPGSFAYFLTWSNVPAGLHSLTAVATATNGSSAVSDPVLIFVVSNVPPPFVVTITEPTNGSSFTSPANIQIDATTIDTNGTVASVSFLAAPSWLGPAPGPGLGPEYAIRLGVVSNGVPGPGSNTEQFSITWSNALVGTWYITAQASATTSNGANVDAFSTPVTITVLPPIPALSVDIATPTNGEIFVAPASIQIIASVTDTNGPVAEVQFFDGTNSIGMVTNGVTVMPPGSPGLPAGSLAYSLTWSNPASGFHDLTAVATASNGMSAVSEPVFIIVISNLPPVVRITSPANHSVFQAPVNIELLAYANDFGGTVSNVQFFAGTNSLGFGLPLLAPGPVTTNPPVFPLNTFELLWTNPIPDSYVLTAVATFGSGDSTTSAPVDITVISAKPPPTNRPNVVNIVATDPIAIEGTNCWVWPGLTNSNAPPTWSNWMSPNALWCSFTNCGPKDATFTVRRHGDTSNDLTVEYTIGGMASNGVDYVALPGTVVIPAGQKEAMITIVPIDADTNNTPDTVILTLSGDTNTPADYVIGFPQSAEALILNSEAPFPRLTGHMLRDHTFCLGMNGPDGGWFRIDFSVDCLNWTPVCTNQVVDGQINFADPNATGSTARWYRTVPLPNGSGN